VDDERPGQHGLELAGEAALGTPREVVPEVVALGPLRESGDVIRVVLIAQDPDGLAAIVLEALAEDLQEQVGDIVPRPGWANNSLVTSVLIGAFLSYCGLSVAGGGGVAVVMEDLGHRNGHPVADQFPRLTLR
jgi:hypothetical protein